MKARITPCLWFDGNGEEAANFYVSVFPNSKITRIQRYTDAGRAQHGREPGSVMVVAFELDGQSFTALNGGPHFKFNEAISLQVDCADQAEVEHYWSKLTEGGDPSKQQCGWAADKYGVSWQIVPKALEEMLADKDTQKSDRALESMMTMKKLDVAALKKAFDG